MLKWLLINVISPEKFRYLGPSTWFSNWIISEVQGKTYFDNLFRQGPSNAGKLNWYLLGFFIHIHLRTMWYLKHWSKLTYIPLITVRYNTRTSTTLRVIPFTMETPNPLPGQKSARSTIPTQNSQLLLHIPFIQEWIRKLPS